MPAQSPPLSWVRTYNRAARTVRLDGPDFGAMGLTRFAAKWIPGGVLALREVAPAQITAKRAVFRGWTSVLGMEDAPCELVLKARGQRTVLVLTVRPNLPWQFSSAFAELRGSVWDDLVFVTPPVLVLASANARITLADGTPWPVTRGLSARAAIQGHSGGLAPLVGVWPLPPTLTLEGSARPSPRGWRWTLEAAEPVSGGPLDDRLDVRFQLVSFFGRQRGYELAEVGVKLVADVALGVEPARISASWAGARGLLRWRGSFDGIPLGGTSVLAPLLGADDALAELPPFLPEQLDITLRELELATRGGAVSTVAVTLGLDVGGPLELVPDWVVLDDLRLVLRVVDPLVPAKRRVFASVLASLPLPARDPVVTLDAWATAPGFEVGAMLPEGGRLALGDLLERALGPGVDAPDIVFDRVGIGVGLGQPRWFRLQAGSDRVWRLPVGGGTVKVEAMSVDLEVAAGQPRGLFQGAIRLGEVTAEVGGAFGPAVSFDATLADVRLSVLLRKLFPDVGPLRGVPEIMIAQGTLSMTPSQGAVAVTGRGSMTWTLGGVDIEVLATVGMSRTREQVEANVELSIDAPIALADGLDLQAVRVACAFATGGAWSVEGHVKVAVLDRPVELRAWYEAGPRAVLSFALTAPIDVGFGDVLPVSLGIRELAFRFARAAGRTDFSVSGTASLQVGDDIDFDGALSVDIGATRKALVLRPKRATLALPIPDPVGDLSVRLGDVVFARLQRGWQIDINASVDLPGGLPSPLDRLLPATLGGRLRIDDGGGRLEILQPLAPQAFDIPPIEVGGKRVDLGVAAVSLDSAAVTLDASREVWLDFAIGLPAELDHALGTNADGTGKVPLFVTYRPGDPDTLFKVRFRASRRGVSLLPLTSPLRAVQFTGGDDAPAIDIDLGASGRLTVEVPELVYGNGVFVAALGATVVEPLSLPLGPAQDLLRALGLDSLAGVLPDAVPIADVDLLDDSGRLRSAEVVALFDGLGADTGALESALDAVSDVVERLPADFTSYLRFTVPQALFVEIGVSPGGSIRAGAYTYDPRQPETKDTAKPIRVLHPGMLPGVVPLPGFTGLTVWGGSFGSFLGGSLLQIEADAILEQFDLLTLAASVALPVDAPLPLPTADELRRRIIVDHLRLLVVYQAVVPIPIPVFYDELGVEYLGIEGLALQAHISFPEPAGGPAVLVPLLAELARFASDEDLRLDPEEAPGGADLVFGMERTFVRLPEYLGGAALGLVDDRVEISAWFHVAHLLNGLKHGNIGDLLQALPLQHRVASIGLDLGPLSFDAFGLVSTPSELRGGAIARLGVGADQIDSFLDLVPASDVAGDGLVILFSASSSLARFASLSGRFGLTAAGNTGFATGFAIEGALGPLLHAALSGRIEVAPGTEEVVAASGAASLEILGREVFTGSLAVTSQSVDFDGMLALFGPQSPLRVGGRIRGHLASDAFALAGGVEVSLRGVVLSASTVDLSDQRIFVRGGWLGTTATLDISLPTGGQHLRVAGTVGFDVHLAFSVGPIVDPWTGQQLIEQIHLDTGFAGALAATFSEDAFAGGVTAAFHWNGIELSVPAFTVSIAPADVAALGEQLKQAVRDGAQDLFDQVVRAFDFWLRAAVDGLVTLVESLGPAVEAAGKWAEGAWDSVATWSVEAWRSASQWSAAAWQATESWGEDAWKATETWGSDAWAATTTWSDETWQSTTGWTAEVWRDTSSWTAAQWRDVESTVGGLLPHGDVALIPHIDVHFVPHGDVRLIPHGDIRLIPHGDVRLIPHVDVRLIPHADVRLIPHADVRLIPHGDVRLIPHADVRLIPHADTPSVLHADFTIPPFGPHVDTPSVLHVDTPSTAHVDTPSTAHVDTASTAHVDTPATAHVDTPSTAHVDTPATAHVDTPATAHVDTPATAHVDTPQTAHGDVAPTAHVDTP